MSKTTIEILEEQKRLIDDCKGDSRVWNDLSNKCDRLLSTLNQLGRQLPKCDHDFGDEIYCEFCGTEISHSFLEEVGCHCGDHITGVRYCKKCEKEESL